MPVKIDRLLEMTILLLNKGSVTAKYLSEYFEVSTRTIYRDIDILSAAGVPVYANRGTGGGIALLDNFSLPKTIVSKEEIDRILFALQTLQATKYPETDKVINKLSALFQRAATDWIQIDFTPWGSNPNEYNKLTDIKNALLNTRVLRFDYIDSQNKKSGRLLEPLRLVYKSQSWYLWGWDLDREDYRTFRISRIKSLAVTDTVFDKNRPRSPNPVEQSDPAAVRPDVCLELRFTENALYRLYDDYDDSLIIRNPDGTYTLHVTFPEDEWVYGYIMSFGPSVEVVSPPRVRHEIRERIERMRRMYDCLSST